MTTPPLRLPAPALAIALALALALPGCTFPWQKGPQESTDTDSNYKEGRGIQLTVENQGNHTFDVTLVVKGPTGRTMGQSELTLAPGEKATRRFQTDVGGNQTAHLVYHFTGEGSAASGIQDETMSNADCDTLRAGTWTLTNVEKTAASQWRDDGCVPV